MTIVKTACWALIGLGVLTVSCVRDEIADCPPLRVKVVVKDKNYFNVDNVAQEQRLRDDLPFREYVPTLYWVLRDLHTGNVVDESPLMNVDGEDTSVSPDIDPNIPHGEYVLTVWGGLDSHDALSDDMTRLNFHPGNTEGRDVYMTCDTLQYDAWHNDYIVDLERTKGKLIVEKVDLPAEIGASEKNISGLCARVNTAFSYDGETSVTKRTQFAPAPQIVTKTVLSPSVKENGSVLKLNFSGNGRAGSAGIVNPEDVNITMYRNELTVLRYVWIPKKKDFEIYMLVNDNWEAISKMEVQ